jgi:hypothetical protein
VTKKRRLEETATKAMHHAQTHV